MKTNVSKNVIVWIGCLAGIAILAACEPEEHTSPSVSRSVRPLSVELAQGKTIDVSSTAGGFDGRYAVDGLYGPGGTSWSSVYETDAWIQVDLGSGHRIDVVQLWNRADRCCPERLQNFYIELSLNGLTWQDSGLGLITTPPSATTPSDYSISGLIARYIRLSFGTPGYHHVGEVEIYGEPSTWPQTRQPVGENLVAPTTLASHGGEIVVSSTAGGFPPSHLNDGDRATSWSSYTDGYATVTVDLGALFALDSVQLSNRGDGCCVDRLRDFYIEVSVDGSSWADSGFGMIRVAPSHLVPTNYPILTYARFVRIRDDAFNAYFHIGEIEIYGF